MPYSRRTSSCRTSHLTSISSTLHLRNRLDVSASTANLSLTYSSLSALSTASRLPCSPSYRHLLGDLVRPSTHLLRLLCQEGTTACFGQLVSRRALSFD